MRLGIIHPEHRSSLCVILRLTVQCFRQFIWREIAKLRLRSSILYLRDQVGFLKTILSFDTKSTSGTEIGQHCSIWSTPRRVLGHLFGGSLSATNRSPDENLSVI